ncbi:hypothetical protein, unlikely [Trypanosoma brucei gambiense DAL972]|uniref:Uncharacterized protein n=1 Tax=Trypanosoma brucei gambiense (strain MHOM/CI/86/DAL972) TaxID=679716 RepID=C9ZYS9_TRYB9|nr:hypothetical protein, unlikely [Trypanosoma brucei gambiense DAL972]CBH14578.1 hypothetical protein, unlikely [Trypanosoma brucei gambiense DAL972]|eukprot:XP_011776844.1 hypothetical protein, unlikely [Trypanosoma brucei gambiense DAL972]
MTFFFFFMCICTGRHLEGVGSLLSLSFFSLFFFLSFCYCFSIGLSFLNFFFHFTFSHSISPTLLPNYSLHAFVLLLKGYMRRRLLFFLFCSICCVLCNFATAVKRRKGVRAVGNFFVFFVFVFLSVERIDFSWGDIQSEKGSKGG